MYCNEKKDKYIYMKMIFPNYPLCTVSLIESYLNYKGLFDDISYIMISYSLKYKKDDEEMRILENQLLNISLTTCENDDINPLLDFDKNNIYLKELMLLYGVELWTKGFSNYKDFREEIHQCLSVNEPVIFQFNLFYIPNRQGYKKLDIDHMIAIIGYDDSTGEYLCLDANENPYFRLSEGDMEQCFYHICNKFHNVKKLNICVNENKEVMIPTKAYLKNKLKEIVLYNSQHGCGIGGFENFCEDIIELFEKNSDSAFDIKDLYKVYKERKTTERVLKNFTSDFTINQELLGELIKCMAIEGKLWMEIFLILKQSILSNEFRYSKQILFLLDKIKKQMYKTKDCISQMMDSI